MDASPFLVEFLSYRQSHPDVIPLRQFPARVGIGSNQPLFSYGLPLGDVLVYPGFFAFLTRTKGVAGLSLIAKNATKMFFNELGTLLTLKRLALHPTTIIWDIARTLGRSRDDQRAVEEALACPNSLFVPFSEITGAESGRSFRQGPYLKLRTRGRNIVICKDGAIGNPFRNMYEHVTGVWEQETVALLREAAGRSFRDRERRQPATS
jgi:hypothetical protein